MDKKYKSPFLGARSYEEKDTANFYGRTEEVDELVDRIQGNYLTVIYGKSGIGKTSLLKAGIIPRLWDMERFLPVYVTLDNESQCPYEEQIIEKAALELEKHLSTGINRTQKLENFLARANWNVTLCPIIIIDQFEEIYYNRASEEKRIALLSALHSILYNKIEGGELHAGNIDIVDFRIAISFREDFLCYIEDDAVYFPPLRENRYRLQALTTSEACNIIRFVGGENGILANNNLPEYIVARLRNEKDIKCIDKTPDMPIDSFDLSLYCQQLDLMRNEQGLKSITFDLVDSFDPDQILLKYYQQVLKGVSRSCALFVEDYMLDDDGRKRKVYKKDALKHGIKAQEITTLISDGIIRELDHDQIEIGHDRVCQVAFRNKAERRAIRERWVYYFILLPFYAFAAFAFYYLFHAGMYQTYRNLSTLDNKMLFQLQIWWPVIADGWLFMMSLLSPLLVLKYLREGCAVRKTALRMSIMTGLGILLHAVYYLDAQPICMTFANQTSDLSWIWISIYAICMAIPGSIWLLTFFYPAPIYSVREENVSLWSISAVRVYNLLILTGCLAASVLSTYNGIAPPFELVVIMLIGFIVFRSTTQIQGSHFIYIFSGCYLLLLITHRGILQYTEPNAFSVGVLLETAFCSLYLLKQNLLGQNLLEQKRINLFKRKHLKYWIGTLPVIIIGSLFCILELASPTYMIALCAVYVALSWGYTYAARIQPRSRRIKIVSVNTLAFILLVIFFKGFNPFALGLTPSDVPKIHRWDHVRIKKDGYWGVADALTGQEIIPYVFDSIGKGDESLVLKCIIPDSGLNVQSIYSVSYDKGELTLRYPTYFDKAILKEKQASDPNISLAARNYESLRNNILQALRHGEFDWRINLSDWERLFDQEAAKLDSIVMKVKASDQQEPVSEDDLVQYTIHMTRQLAVAGVIDAVNDNYTPAQLIKCFALYSGAYYTRLYGVYHREYNSQINVNINNDDHYFYACTASGVEMQHLMDLRALWKWVCMINFEDASSVYLEKTTAITNQWLSFGNKVLADIKRDRKILSDLSAKIDKDTKEGGAGTLIGNIMQVSETASRMKNNHYSIKENQPKLMSYRYDCTRIYTATNDNINRLTELNQLSRYNYGLIKEYYIDNLNLLAMSQYDPEPAISQLKKIDSLRDGAAYNSIQQITKGRKKLEVLVKRINQAEDESQTLLEQMSAKKIIESLLKNMK